MIGSYEGYIGDNGKEDENYYTGLLYGSFPQAGGQAAMAANLIQVGMHFSVRLHSKRFRA